MGKEIPRSGINRKKAILSNEKSREEEKLFSSSW
jgi:hypothetical protein